MVVPRRCDTRYLAPNRLESPPDPDAVPPSPRHRQHARRGFSSANTVVWLPVIIMMSWWALENAILYRWAYRAQAAADAAALAAAARYRDGRETASDDAQTAAGAVVGPAGTITIDVGDGSSGGNDLEFGLWDDDTGTFTPDPTDGGEAVRVTVRFAPGHPNGAPTMILGGLFTPGGISISRRSTAVYVPPRHETSMLVTATIGTSLSLQGTSVLSSRGGVSLATNSSTSALVATGARASVAVLRTAGSVDKQVREALDGALEEGATIPDDPFASIPMPAIDASAASPITLSPSGTTMVPPGVHSGLVASAGTIVLLPGLHQFVGVVSLDGTAALQLSSATIQLDAGVALALAGNAAISGTPAAGIPNWDDAFLMTRGDLSSWSIAGAATIDVDGMLYAPAADLSVEAAAEVRCASVVARTVTSTETGAMALTGEIEELETDPVPGRARLVR